MMYVGLPFCRLHLTALKTVSYDSLAPLKTWGQRIRKRREDVAISLEQLAERLGVDRAVLECWEAGEEKPSWLHMPQIIAFLRFNPQAEPSPVNERLKQYRMRHGLSQAQLANAIGVKRSAIADWESGRHQPRKRLIERIDQILDSVHERRCSS